MSATEFESARLTFRIPARSDFDDSARLWSDPVVVRYTSGRPFTPEESWARLLRHVGHWQIARYGFWVVREQTSGEFVGEVGFGDFRRNIDPPLGDAPEVGWVLSPAAHGKGFGTEAARAAIAWMEETHTPARTVCIIQPENASSLRIAQKCGYREFARTVYKDAPVILLERNGIVRKRDRA